MAFQLIEVILPKDKKEETEELLKKFDVMDYEYDESSEKHLKFNIIVEQDKNEELMEDLQKKYSKLEYFRIIIIPVDAVIPLPEDQKTKQKDDQEGRISREEIYAKVSEMSELSKIYMILVAASAFVASIGLINDDVAVIIGAMIITPLIGPSIGLSLANVMGNREFAYKAIKTNLVGILIASIISIILGIIFTVNPQNPSIVLRTDVARGSFFLALASGLAGSLAVTSGLTSAFVGVMIAVALLPPLAAFGLLVGSGNYILAFGAILLFSVNFVCINLTATVSFMVQKIEPWEDKAAVNAKIMRRRSLIMWFLLLIILYGIITFQRTLNL
ncbi:TIGR00341 family protein [Methanobacterium sp. ACI-7]|uniref:TIGR00341 family protein n=1 Tax=unclassified Methanobacterium TaxID=2627676 RepID=UPI0039C11C36